MKEADAIEVAVRIVTEAVEGYNDLPKQRKLDLANGACAALSSLTPRADRTEREATDPDPNCEYCFGSGSVESGGDEAHTAFSVACICTAPIALRPTPPVEGDAALAQDAKGKLCEDCPPVGYPTDKTRCAPCPRTAPPTEPER